MCVDALSPVRDCVRVGVRHACYHCLSPLLCGVCVSVWLSLFAPFAFFADDLSLSLLPPAAPTFSVPSGRRRQRPDDAGDTTIADASGGVREIGGESATKGAASGPIDFLQRLEAIERNEAAAGPPCRSGLPLGTGTRARGWRPRVRAGRRIGVVRA